MGSFSFADAASAGFRVIGRKPLALLAWAAVYLVFVVAPAIAIIAHVVPAAIAAYQDLGSRMATHPDPAAMMALQARTFGWQPIVWLLQIVTGAVVIGAMFRAVLEPQNSRWAYLRLSHQELWLGLTYLVLMVMSVILIVVLCIPVAIASGILVALAERGGGSVVGSLLLVLMSLGGVGLVIWVLLRLSLSLPMSFAQGRFLFYESWDLTRGQAGKMFLVFLLLIAGVALLEFVAVSGVALTLLPHAWDAGGAALGEDLAAAMDHARQMAPLFAAAAVVASVIAMAVHTVLVAPLAEIYRELAATGPLAPGAGV